MIILRYEDYNGRWLEVRKDRGHEYCIDTDGHKPMLVGHDWRHVCGLVDAVLESLPEMRKV